MAGRSLKRGGTRGGFKKSFSQKRSAVGDEDTGPHSYKKTKTDDAASDDEAGPFVPKLKEDDEDNTFVAIKSNGTRRVVISQFKNQTLISIREFYKAPDGDKMLPGKKGISLTVDQYNNLMAAAPLLEQVLKDKNETVVRPNYDQAAPRAEAKDKEDDDGQGTPVSKASNNDDNEEEEEDEEE